jgi:hypothetical protein
VAQAREVVESYAPLQVTLRQVFYRLTALQVIRNHPYDYIELGRHTAEARRTDGFPRLIDNGRSIDRPFAFDDLDDMQRWLLTQYRRDRTEGQPYRVYLGTEKATMVGILDQAFSERGIPIVATRGMSGQELVTDVVLELEAEEDERESVLLYAGDFDPSGMRIGNEFVERVGLFDHYIRVALDHTVVGQLPESIQPAKPDDPNMGRFRAYCSEHGVEPCQIELEALPPEELVARFEAALTPWWDVKAHRRSLRKEAADRRTIREWLS